MDLTSPGGGGLPSFFISLVIGMFPLYTLLSLMDQKEGACLQKDHSFFVFLLKTEL